MNPINEMNLRIPSCSLNESFARAAVSAFVCQLDPTIDELTDIKTAVSEAVTNSIIHGYKDIIGQIFINVKIFDGGIIQIRIRDKGCGIEDIKQAMQPLYSSEKTERAGLGFAVMQSFMDNLKVTSKPDAGTTVLMEKRIIRRVIHNE